jgi:predicted alpha/beta superfamily hydrolase
LCSIPIKIFIYYQINFSNHSRHSVGMKPISAIVSGIFLVQLANTLHFSQNLPGVTGTLIQYESMPSAFVESRRIDIWLPPSYESDTDKRYPVLYMHDGQNLFDPATSYIGVDWGIVEELKPFVDGNYRTLPGRNDIFIMGSSMGGLISLYAVCEYPNVFGGAGCVSTHWPAGRGIVIDYFRKHVPVPGEHKFYFDYGTETIDSLYEPYQKQIDEIMLGAGYRNNIDWLTVKYEGDEHSERAWRRRVNIPIFFLISM